jgi:hypothetical protein
VEQKRALSVVAGHGSDAHFPSTHWTPHHSLLEPLLQGQEDFWHSLALAQDVPAGLVPFKAIEMFGHAPFSCTADVESLSLPEQATHPTSATAITQLRIVTLATDRELPRAQSRAG